MKILFVIKNMNSAKGGAERVLAQVANGLSERGHNTYLLTCDKREGTPYYPLNDKIKRVSLAIGDADQHAGVMETIGRIRALRSVINVKKPDIIIAFMHSMFVPVSIAAIGTNIPVIASEHIVPAHYRTRPLQFLMLMLSSFFVKSMTVLSDSVRKSYPLIVRRKMVVIPNPVTEPEDLKTPAKKKRKTILNVGRLAVQKDQQILVRAFAKIADKHPDWDVKIFGEGELRNSLESLIEKLGMKERIFLPGTTKKIGKEYAKADIFALPSRYESFGLATAEAMSYGVAPIGFQDCPGTNELITNGFDGVLVAPKDHNRVKVFAEALERLIEDEDLRTQLGQDAKKSVERYKPDVIVDMWDDLIVKTTDFQSIK